MISRLSQFCCRNLLAPAHRGLERTRLWQFTSRRERVLAAISLLITLPSVYYLAQDAQASQHLSRQIHCLAMNIYHEARGEPIAGQYAVAEVTLNRSRSREFPSSICRVVYQKHWNAKRKENIYAFSWAGMSLPTNTNSAAWRQALQIARTVLTGDQIPTLRGALFYHSIDIKPGWSRRHKRVAIIGHHIFYL
ncbi:MAG: cell wall hydrolase [Gammaproteobacteria bacterium]|jgi:N-acetylmuramoyl-L-alanine amidase